MKTSFIFLADGFEEVEAMTSVDVMRRAGMPVVTVSINEGVAVTGAPGVTVVACCKTETQCAIPAWKLMWKACAGVMPRLPYRATW